MIDEHLRVEQDTGRFRQIVRGHVKQNLRKYMSKGEMIGRQGKDLLSIPGPLLDLPHFRFNDRQMGGVGQGEGEGGTPIGQGDQADGEVMAGDQPGHHIL
jgi:uncharacterized sporulation protein YeaH/YhbH (DUF444 family)